MSFDRNDTNGIIWAIGGAGHNNFGIVTRLRLKVYKIDPGNAVFEIEYNNKADIEDQKKYMNKIFQGFF